jgi:hypothetical protein
MADKERAYEIPEDTGVQDLQTVPGVPGRFMPGEPVTASEVGLKAGEFDDVVKEADAGDVLKRTTATPPKKEQWEVEVEEQMYESGRLMHELPERPASQKAPSAVEAAELRSVSPAPGLSAEEYEAREAFDAERRGEGEVVQAGAEPEEVTLVDAAKEKKG